jgi:WD40 repeat protein/serine/threonine protein kinase
MTHKCPPQEELRAFHLGVLPESAVDALGEHLEHCPDCEATLQHWEESDDPFYVALRQPVKDKNAAITTMQGANVESEFDSTFVLNVPALPGYEILDTLGHGGMGVVYKARQLRLNREVALKHLSCKHERDLMRARREAEALARLQHPNIVQIFEVVEHEGRVYLALELIEGGPLSTRLNGKPQPPNASAQLIETLARAIHYAHQRGIVHRDLKPSNVLLANGFPTPISMRSTPADLDGPSRAAWSRSLPKITDFGIAKQLSRTEAETRDGDVIGTPSYMAPEQAGGEASQIGPAADVYSLGVLLYEMLTGRVPLLDVNVLDTLLRVRNEEPVSPRRLQPRLPRDLETICLKCLRKEPSQRYASAEQLADDLHRFLSHEPIRARPTPIWERFRKWIRRSPGIAALSTLLVLMAVLGFSLVAWQWQRAEDKADDEAKARLLAQDREQAEKEARLQIQRLVARSTLREGVNLCENGETERGLLWMVRALELAEADGDDELGRAARCNLAAWSPFLVRLQAEMAHTGWIWTLAFSPDGRTVATGGIDAMARLWDVEGKPHGEPLHHRYPVWHVALSPDGKSLLTGSGEASAGEGRLYDVSTGQLRASWTHPSGVLGVAFHPSGRTCLTLSVEEAIVRNVADGKPMGEAMKHPRPYRPLPGLPQPLSGGFSPDGKLVVTVGEDGTVRFWDAATGKPQGQTLQTSRPIQTFAFSPDGRTLMTGCIDGRAQLWDVASGKPSSPILAHRGHVRAVAFSPDGKLAATASAVQEVNLLAKKIANVAGEVRLWRVPTGEMIGAPLPHSKTVWSLAFSPKGRRLLTGCEDGFARLFLVATGERIAKVSSNSGTITQVAFNRDGTHCLISGAGGGERCCARLWHVAPEDHLPLLLLHNDTVNTLCFSPDGSSLLSGGDDRLAQLWDVANGERKGPPLPHEYPVSHAVFNPDGRSLFTACEGSTPNGMVWDAALWDLNGERKRPGMNAPHRVKCAAFCEEGRALVVGDIEGNIQLHETATGKPIGTPLHQHGAVHSLEFSPDEQTLLTGSVDGAILWDWSTRRQLKRLASGRGDSLAYFYPGGMELLLVQNGFAQVWDGTGSERKAPPLFHAEGGINRLAFGPDSRSVLIGDSESRVRLWDVANGMKIGPAPGPRDTSLVAFSPKGQHFAVAGKQGRVALWETPQPMQGSVERLRLWTEALAGMEIDERLIIRPLDSDEVRRRRARLDELGGPPANCY